MLPKGLTGRDQWVVWRRVVRKGKPTKVPFQFDGCPAKSNDPGTWTSYRNAVTAYQTKKFEGVGFMFHAGDGIAGIDLDHVIDTETGEIDPRALDILAHFPGCYVEFSPSGDGLHIWCLGKPWRCGKGTVHKWVELYDHTSPRYLTVTNRAYGAPGDLVDAQAGLDWLHQAYFDKPAPVKNPPRDPAGPPPSFTDRELIDKASRRAKFARLWAGDWQDAYPSQSEADQALCNSLAFWTGGDPARMDALFRQSGLMRPKWDSKRGGTTYGAVTIDQALATTSDRYDPTRGKRGAGGRPPNRDRGGGDEGPPGDDGEEDRRPVIRLRGGGLNQIMAAMETALMAGEQPAYFTRSGNLVRIVYLDRDVERPGHSKRHAGTPQLAEVGTGWYLSAAQRAARFQRWDARRGEWTECDLPERYAKIYLDQRQWAAPVLQSIVEAPLMREDGTLHATPGYDPATRCFLHFEDAITLPERIGEDDIRWAVDLWHDLFDSFPFDAPHDFSALLAAILTDLIRPLLPTAPMFAVRAPSAGTGKTLLGRLIALITTGREPSTIAHPGDEIEFAKSVFAGLLGGDRIMFVDNVEDVLQSPTLCAVLTSGEHNGRMLGRSQMAKVSTRVTWILTGNNMQVHGDLIRRILPIDLDAKMERPEDRIFERDAVAQVLAHRRDYLTAGLMILRHYAQDGYPDQGLTLGSFEVWSRRVRCALIYAGLPDPCLGLMDWAETDRVSANLRALLDAWQFTGVAHLPMKSQEIIAKGSEYPDLQEALVEICADNKGNLSPRILGRWLARWVGRVEGGLKLVRARDDGHHKVAQFKVVEAKD